MKLKDILSNEEIQKYHQQWDLFKHRNIYLGRIPKIESEHNVHSGLPVISKVFQYEDYPIFRTHIFQNRLRKIDPYFISKKYIHPFWHAQHYFTVMEQLYHTSLALIDNTDYATKDLPENFEWKLPIFWKDTISNELILENLGNQGKYSKKRGNFTFYKKNRPISKISFLTYSQPRIHIRIIQKIKQGDPKAIEELISKIKAQDIKQKRLIKPRTNLPEKDYLISELEAGRIPEQELNNFFSFWDF